jgi:hypothetical protein
VNRRVVDDEDRVGERPFVHEREKALHETAEGRASDRVLDNLQVEDTVEGEGWEDGIFSSPELKLVPRSTFATFRPRVWPPQRQPVEMAFVGKNEMFGAVVGVDESPELISIQLVSL